MASVQKQTVTQYEMGTWSNQDFRNLYRIVKEWRDKQPWTQPQPQGESSYQMSTTEKELDAIAQMILREGTNVRG